MFNTQKSIEIKLHSAVNGIIIYYRNKQVNFHLETGIIWNYFMSRNCSNI